MKTEDYKCVKIANKNDLDKLDKFVFKFIFTKAKTARRRKTDTLVI